MPDYTVEYALNRAQPAEVADLLRKINAGTTMRGLMKPIRQTIPVADLTNLGGGTYRGTLAYKPAYVESFVVTDLATINVPHTILPSGMNPGSGQVSITHETGGFVVRIAGSVGSVTIVYAPMPTNADNIDASWPY